MNHRLALACPLVGVPSTSVDQKYSSLAASRKGRSQGASGWKDDGSPTRVNSECSDARRRLIRSRCNLRILCSTQAMIHQRSW